MTFNDEVNTLAAREFEHHFGRANVYQLPSSDRGTGKRVSISDRLRGRILFRDGLHHERLMHRILSGAVVKRTQLTDTFSYDDFCDHYGPSARLLFLIDEDRQLSVVTSDDGTVPRAGQTVIARVDVPEKEEQAS